MFSLQVTLKLKFSLLSGRHYHLVTSAHSDSFSVHDFTNYSQRMKL